MEDFEYVGGKGRLILPKKTRWIRQDAERSPEMVKCWREIPVQNGQDGWGIIFLSGP